MLTDKKRSMKAQSFNLWDLVLCERDGGPITCQCPGAHCLKPWNMLPVQDHMQPLLWVSAHHLQQLICLYLFVHVVTLWHCSGHYSPVHTSTKEAAVEGENRQSWNLQFWYVNVVQHTAQWVLLELRRKIRKWLGREFPPSNEPITNKKVSMTQIWKVQRDLRGPCTSYKDVTGCNCSTGGTNWPLWSVSDE